MAAGLAAVRAEKVSGGGALEEHGLMDMNGMGEGVGGWGWV